MFSFTLSEQLQISPFLMLWLGLLIWAPFLTVIFVRQWKEAAREKQDLQARFDAEDKALFGENHKLN